MDDSIDESVCFNEAEVKYFGGGTEEVVTDAFMSQDIDDAELESKAKSKDKPAMVQIIFGAVVVLGVCTLLVLYIICRKV